MQWRHSYFQGGVPREPYGLEEDPFMYRKFMTLAAGALVLGAASMSTAEAAGKNICVLSLIHI